MRKNGGGGLIYFFLLLFLLLEVQGGVLITEIMYDSPGTDSKHEWLEVQNSETDMVNLTLWKLREGGINHGLGLVSGDFLLLPEEFVVIANDEKTFLEDYSEFTFSNGTLLDTTFTSGLSNNGEKLELLNGSGQVVFSVVYNVSWGGAGNNNTLCWHNSSWKECLATPGKANLVAPISEWKNFSNSPGKNTSVISAALSPHLSNDVFVGKSYDDLFKITIENKKNCSIKDKIQLRYDITSNTPGVNYLVAGNRTKEVGCSSYADTGEFTPLMAGEYLLCGKISKIINSTADYSANPVCYAVKALDTTTVPCNASLTIKMDDSVDYSAKPENSKLYQQDQSIKFTPGLNAENYPYIIEYWIEDLFGNMVKNKYNTTNTNQKSWKADIKEEDRVLWIKAKVYPFCKDVDLEDNSAAQMLIVTNKGVENSLVSENGESKENASSIEIIKISPSPAKYGETLKAEVEIYKGNTNKYLVSAWVEMDGKEISEKTKAYLHTKYQKYELSLPALLDDKCGAKEGEAKVMVSGLDEEAEESIEVKNPKKCAENKGKAGDSKAGSSEKASSASKAKFSYVLEELPDTSPTSQPLALKVKLTGNEEEHKLRLWSYIYRGSKCYSCGKGEREDNAQEILLKKSEEKIITFYLEPNEETEEGEYKVMVKLQKDGQKTVQELTQLIYLYGVETAEEKVAASPVLGGKKGENEADGNSTPLKISKVPLSGANGYVVYESSTERAKEVVPYLMLVAVLLLGVILFRKN